MIIIIDAYNFLKRNVKDKFITESQRQQFLNLLNNYAKKKINNNVIIVFDGGSGIRPEIDTFKNVTVIYSGVNFTADDVIKEHIEKLAAQNKSANSILVSSDRELKTFASSYKVEILDPEDFFKIIQLTLQEKKLVTKPNFGNIIKFEQDERNEDLDKLMQEAATISTFKEDFVEEDKQEKLSKKEKKLLNLLKKL
ncbi:NYN domain-containing protein [Candidatus Dependentiae bacterium]|nr:NYN domain-containing protein [Candidatus Dependentiae bacterium]